VYKDQGFSQGSDILNPAGFERLLGKSGETNWHRAGCPGHGGAGILPAASHSATDLVPEIFPESRKISGFYERGEKCVRYITGADKTSARPDAMTAPVGSQFQTIKPHIL